MKALIEAEETMHVDMTPLVDAIFAIILFLLVVSSYVESTEQDINISLPTMGAPVKYFAPRSRPIIVNVRYMPGGEAYYHVENNRTSVAALTVDLGRARSRDKEQAVVIRGDKNVKWDHVAKIMTACAQAQITKVSATVEVQE
jgi:biopolymer transport protein ExbD